MGVWQYKYPNTANIKRAFAYFIWVQEFSNNAIDMTISVFNDAIIDVISNYKWLQLDSNPQPLTS